MCSISIKLSAIVVHGHGSSFLMCKSGVYWLILLTAFLNSFPLINNRFVWSRLFCHPYHQTQHGGPHERSCPPLAHLCLVPQVAENKFIMLLCFININNKSIKCFHDVSDVALVQKGFQRRDTDPQQSNFGCQRRWGVKVRRHTK